MSEPASEIAAAGSDISGTAGGPDAGSGPAALADLVAAGLVSHEMIGDPARLGGEAATLRALCRHVAGAIWRIEPYHYAFRLGAAAAADAGAGSGVDIEADTGSADSEAAAAALEARLAAELGADAVWVSATDLIATDTGTDTDTDRPEAAAVRVDLDAPLLLLRAGAEAVADGLAAAGSGVQAVVSAGFAARAARIAADLIEAGQIEAGRAGGEPEPGFAPRLAAIEAGQARIEAALAAEAESRAAAAAAELRLTELLAKVLRRLDAQADVLHGHIAREDQVAARLGEIAALAGAAGTSAAGFQETLGLTLAEFLARLERREAAPVRVPQVI